VRQHLSQSHQKAKKGSEAINIMAKMVADDHIDEVDVGKYL